MCSRGGSMDERVRFGRQLRSLRVARGWTVSEAAARAGLRQQTLSRLEARRTLGHVEAWVVVRLARVYAVSMESLCVREGED